MEEAPKQNAIDHYQDIKEMFEGEFSEILDK